MRSSLAHVTSKFLRRFRTWRPLLIVGIVCIALLGQGTAAVSALSVHTVESSPRFVLPSDIDDDAAEDAEEDAMKAAESAADTAKKALEAAEKAAKETLEDADKAVDAAEKAAKKAREFAKDVREAGEKAVKEAREAAQKSAKEAREAAEKIEKALSEKSPEDAAKEVRDANLTAAKEAREATEKATEALDELELAEEEFDLLSDMVDAIKDRIALATTASDRQSLNELLNSVLKLQLSAAEERTDSVYKSLKSAADATFKQEKRAITADYRFAILAAMSIFDSADREAAITAAKVASDARKTEARFEYLAAKADARRFLGRAQVITFLAPASVLETVGAFTISATSTSGLAVVVSSNSLSICTVNGTTVSIVGAGQCALTASQAGTGRIAPAQHVSLAVTVVVVPPTTTSTSSTTTIPPTTTTTTFASTTTTTATTSPPTTTP